jgi:hypothetical protein
MGNISITAIIVLYHSKHLLPKIIENISLKIIGLNEIILVDNSKEELSKFENDIIKIIHPKNNIGYGAAINLGISAAKNDVIIAMNPDIEILEFNPPTILTPKNLFIASGAPVEWPAIRKFPDIRYDMLRLLLKNLSKIFQFVDNLSGWIRLDKSKKFIEVDWVSGAMIITNKYTMKILSGFDENFFLFYEELDLCKRASKKNIPRYIIPAIRFCLNAGTSSSIDANEIKYTSEIKSIKRYHLKYQKEKTTKYYFVVFKPLFYFISTSLSFVNFFFNNAKIGMKAKQYLIYAKTF